MLLCLVGKLSMNGQDSLYHEDFKNSFSISITPFVGDIPIFHLNYERLLIDRKSDFYWSIGTYLPILTEYREVIKAYNTSLLWVIGKKNHKFDFGPTWMYFTYVVETVERVSITVHYFTNSYPGLTLGYRYNHPNKRFLFKFQSKFLIDYLNFDINDFPYGMVFTTSFGYRF